MNLQMRSKVCRLNKKPLFLVAGMVVLIIGTLIFNSILESRSLKLEERNSRTEYNNNQYKIQQKKLRIKRTLLLNKENRIRKD
jgi:hypothetical protein